MLKHLGLPQVKKNIIKKKDIFQHVNDIFVVVYFFCVVKSDSQIYSNSKKLFVFKQAKKITRGSYMGGAESNERQRQRLCIFSCCLQRK